MAPRVDPVASDETLPARADIVIIGGGIIGTSAALFLAERGVSVALVEKGHIAGEQSSRNWGWCRKMVRDPREIPLIIESLRLWQGMNQMVEAETGFRTCGIMYLAESPADLARLEGWLDYAREYQLDTRVDRWRRGGAPVARLGRVLGRRALYAERRQGRAADGGAGDRCRGAPPWREGPHRVRRARHRDRGRPGRGRGHRKGPHRLRLGGLAGGAWSRLFCGNLGIDLPQLKVLGSVMRTEPLEGGPEISASGGLFGYRKRMDGGYTVATLGVRTIDLVPDSFRLLPQYLPSVRLHWQKLRFRVGRRFAEEWQRPRRWALDEPSPFEAVRVLDPEADPYVLERARASIAAAFPAFRNVAVAESWGGMIDVMPDAIPVISAVDSLPGFFIATGFSGHGFGIGPGAGRLIADMATGAPAIVDPAPFRLGRFTDGSNPRPHPLAS